MVLFIDVRCDGVRFVDSLANIVLRPLFRLRAFESDIINRMIDLIFLPDSTSCRVTLAYCDETLG